MDIVINKLFLIKALFVIVNVSAFFLSIYFFHLCIKKINRNNFFKYLIIMTIMLSVPVISNYLINKYYLLYDSELNSLGMFPPKFMR